MSRLEDDLRDLFLRNEEGAPLVDLGEPEHIARRTRRRQVLVAGTTTILAVVLIAGAVVGIGALVDGERSTPAQPTPPDEAPVVIDRGAFEGWDWVLSASEDGRCVALSDGQGSTTICPTAEETAALGVPESEDLIGVTVQSPGTPGPESIFVFGIVSPRTTDVGVGLHSFVEADELALHRAPSGVESDRGYFVARIDGFPYPVVPDIVVSANDPDGAWVDVTTVERPPWAVPPYELIDEVAAGTWVPPAEVGGPVEWEFGVWRNHLQDGMLCYPSAWEICGPPNDPTSAWRWSGALAVVSTDERWYRESQTPGAEYQTATHGEGAAFFVGVFEEPVASVRVELTDRAPFVPEMYPSPTGYPGAPRLFVFDYAGHSRDLRGRFVGLDAEGNVVATVRI